METDQANIEEAYDKNKPNIEDISTNNQTSLSTTISCVPITSTTPAEGSILFAETSTVNHNKLKRRGPLMESRISNTLSSLGEDMRKMTTASSSRLAEKLLKSSETYGSFIMWMPEPSLPSRYSGSIEMPSREIQLALIDQYFHERHESIGMIVKYYFYEQLETKGLLITPLLLNVIYAHASRFVNIPGCPKTEVFYHRARRLVDDFMDVPRVSTIVALCLLSLYEPSPAIYRPGSHHCRQWQYSGMACRMSLELGLYDDNNVHSSLTPVEIELRRRVFWGCYDLDKFQSGGWERPWMISKSFIRTSLPSVLPEETEEDAHVIDVCNAKIRFVKIVEDNLVILSASQAFLGGNNGNDNFLGIPKDSMLTKINENLTKHQIWLQSLKLNMQWTPVTTISVKDVLELPASRPMVGHLHLYYNALTLALLEKLPNNSVAQFQSRVTAASMTQLAHHLCQTPSYVVKFDFIVHALICAIKIHIHYLDDTDVNLAQQAWLLFDRSIWCMQLINSYAVIPNCLKFLQQVQNIYGLHMPDNNNYSSSGSPSPKSKNRTVNDKTSPLLQKQKPILRQNSSPLLQRHEAIPLTADSSNSRRIIDRVQYPDDINQILTDWTPAAATNTANEQQNNNILQLESNNNNNRNSNIVYSNTHNTQMHPHYHQFNVNISTRTPQHGYQQSPTSNTFSNNLPPPSIHRHTRTQSNHLSQSQHIWNGDAGFNSKSDIYDSRDIVVPSQLNEDSAADNNNRPTYGHTRFASSDESSIWRPQNPPGVSDHQETGKLNSIYMVN